MQADYDRAQRQLETALALGRVIAAKATLSAALGGLGEVALARGEVGAASQHYREGLILGWEGDFPLGVALNLQGLVRLGSRSDQLIPVARVAGALGAFSGAMHALPGAVTEAYEANVATVRAALGEEAFAAAQAAGRLLPLPEIVGEAISLPTVAVPRVTDAAPCSSALTSLGLSAREHEVLRMVAAGHSDQEIAHALCVSRRTINTHVSNILNKLGVASRSAAVALAVRRGLV
jgi:DNA-binding CsgD family transcriptional regulator